MRDQAKRHGHRGKSLLYDWPLDRKPAVAGEEGPIDVASHACDRWIGPGRTPPVMRRVGFLKRDLHLARRVVSERSDIYTLHGALLVVRNRVVVTVLPISDLPRLLRREQASA